MHNVRLVYLYRDGSNYKRWSDVTFCNPEGLSLVTIGERLRAAFLPDGLFIAHRIGVPEVFLSDQDCFTHDDHCFHEFDSVEVTAEAPKDRRTVSEFIREVEGAAREGWKAFDPADRFYHGCL